MTKMDGSIGKLGDRRAVLPRGVPTAIRIAQWLPRDIGIVDTVADNASSGLFVLQGPVGRLDGLELRALQMQVTRKDEVVSNAMARLAGELARGKRPLRAGDVVLSGRSARWCR